MCASLSSKVSGLQSANQQFSGNYHKFTRPAHGRLVGRVQQILLFDQMPQTYELSSILCRTMSHTSSEVDSVKQFFELDFLSGKLYSLSISEFICLPRTL